MLTRLMEMDKNSRWEEIISSYGTKEVSDVITAEILGKAYRMTNQYQSAINTFQKGYSLANSGFTKGRFLILVADCFSLMGSHQMEADMRLAFIDNLKFKATWESDFIGGWASLQKAKYENDEEQKLQYLIDAKQRLEASWVSGEYDILLRKRLLITVYQQIFGLYLKQGNFEGAENMLLKAQNNANEPALEYERISLCLSEAVLEKAKGNMEAAKTAANAVIKAALTQRMVDVAKKIIGE